MRRQIFFLLERLKITPGERKSVMGLCVMLLLLVTLNMTLTPSNPFGKETYVDLEKQFNDRTAALHAEEEQLMKRYFPFEEKASFLPTLSDTLPPDSIRHKPPGENIQPPMGILININTAGREALESLPGIGPVYAQRIIDYRRMHGEFRNVEELINIKGIAEKRLDKLKAFVKLTDPE